MSEPGLRSVVCLCRFADPRCYRGRPLGEPLQRRGHNPLRQLAADAFIHLLEAPDLNFLTERECAGEQMKLGNCCPLSLLLKPYFAAHVVRSPVDIYMRF